MAKQKGIIKINGTLGDITFSRTKDGYIAKEKTSLSGSRIKNDPSFQRTRENNAEFGTACISAKYIRAAFRSQLQLAKDGNVVSRLVKEVMKVIHTDPVSGRGERNLPNGQVGLLKDFQFNQQAELGSTLYAQYTTSLDRASGTAQVSIPVFTPLADIVAPQGGTHFKLVSAAAAIDFTTGIYLTVNNESRVLPWDNTAVPAMVLDNTLPAASTDTLFLVFGIQFYQQVNGADYPLKNGIFNPLGIVNLSAV